MGLLEIQKLKEAAKMPRIKKNYVIPKKSAKRIAQEEEERLYDLSDWFKDRRKEMTGICAHCGGKSMKDDNDKYHYSIAHILPKCYFPSVSIHKDNWIELCFYGNSCHTNFDNYRIDIIDLNCFDSVIKKVVSIYPSIEPSERKRIPAILLEYLNVEK